MLVLAWQRDRRDGCTACAWSCASVLLPPPQQFRRCGSWQRGFRWKKKKKIQLSIILLPLAMWLWETVLLRWCGKTNFPGSNPREWGLGLLICKPQLCPARLPSTPWLQRVPSRRPREQSSTSEQSSYGGRNQKLRGHQHMEEAGFGDGLRRVQGSAWRGEELQLRV